MNRQASAPLTPKRQRSQYTCMATSLSMCLEALGMQDAGEDAVNRVMGAAPMQGASWEQAFAAAQHYGARTTLTCPATLAQVKAYTDRGIPVMIAWNPEGRPWSHASVIFHVDDNNVHVADPNIPDPDELVRVVPKAEFYGKWYEKFPDYLVRRPAMAVEREISPEGRQMVAKQTLNVKVDGPRNPFEKERGQRNWGGGSHQNRDLDVTKGQSRKDKHKKDWQDKESGYTGNPDGESIYPNEIEHGYGEPLAGGTDVMRRLQNQLLHEQGHDDQTRPENPRLATLKRLAEFPYQDPWEKTPRTEFIAYMNANAVAFQKGRAWWLPGRNLAVSLAPDNNVNVWWFTILPLVPARRAYKPESEMHPEGIVIHPSWKAHHKLKRNYEINLELAQKLATLAGRSPTLASSVKTELKWIENHFSTRIPMGIVAKLAMEAPKMAAKRWLQQDNIDLKDVFLPFDGSKPVQLNTSAVKQLTASVVSRYLNRLEEGTK